MHENMVILGIILVILGYGYYSKLLNRFYITGPMVFVTIGILLSPLFFGAKILHFEGELVQTMAEIALIVVLFADASTLNLKHFGSDWRLPARMLGIALPLTIVAAAAVAMWFFPDQPPLYLLLLSLFLAPTDAALGKAVVTDPTVPERIRSTINVESGLNDGFVFPVLITVVAMIGSGQEHGESNSWLVDVLQQIVLGGLAGAIVGFAGAKQARISIRRDWLEESYRNLIPFALALFSYYVSEFVGGNGYIGAFVSGMVLGNLNHELHENIEAFLESEGELLILIIFTLFGLVFVPLAVDYWNMKVLLFAFLSLTVLRMVPIAVSLAGLKLDRPTKLFLGWFGPRGIASILYVMIVIHQLGGIEGHEVIYGTVTLTVLLSIFLHGMSAKPLANLYARYLKKTGT
ncbi:cation:proton antiporter [Hydrogenimonas urashimensis]|uniref:cation:proton antiporter n=1 Tax=Hydrogenimonas urashimensis TaxID=2740515 RepID=UPI001915D2E9|nr:cation:proton antiporter [Hydrogenimonas urashimensis]